MKKLIAINGSPRKNWNTAQLLNKTIQGAQEAGAEAEIVNLYSLNFKGCTSYFACKIKNREHGVCAMKDDLSPVLEKVKTADAIIFGTPVYYMNFSAGMVAFIERFFFSNTIYSFEVPTVLPKKIPSAYFLTMNMNAEQFLYYKMDARLASYTTFTKTILGITPKVLCAYNTVQFKDYSRYESSMFNPEEKFAYREEVFEGICNQAYEIGRDLVSS